MIKRTFSGVCEISTGALTVTNSPPAFTGENGAMAVEVSFQQDGQPADLSGLSADLYFYYADADEMTDTVPMRISGSTAAGTVPDSLTVQPGSPLLTVRLTDTDGRVLVACAAPVLLNRVTGGLMVTGRPPTPSEVVYTGRAPYIGKNGNWFVWNNELLQYTDTGIKAQGPRGQKGETGDVNKKPMPPMTVWGNATEKEAPPQDLTKAQAWKVLGDAPNAEKLGGETISEVKSGENALHNWYFKNLINQRNTTNIDGKSGPDRWISYVANSRVIPGVGIEIGTGAVLTQRPIRCDIVGKMYTCSVLTADGRLYWGSGIWDGKNETSFFKGDGLNAYIPGASMLQIGATDSTIIEVVKLEPGTHPTGYKQDPDTGKWSFIGCPPDKATELIKCQRYYKKYGIVSLRTPEKVWGKPILDFGEMEKTPTVKIEAGVDPAFLVLEGVSFDKPLLIGSSFASIHIVQSVSEVAVFALRNVEFSAEEF